MADVSLIPKSSNLTPREREALSLIAQGLTFAAAAERLVVSPYTVSNHVRNARYKLHAVNCVHAIFILLSDSDTNSTVAP
jgi:DNA-binding CsgD family transcriptional regulator